MGHEQNLILFLPNDCKSWSRFKYNKGDRYLDLPLTKRAGSMKLRPYLHCDRLENIATYFILGRNTYEQ